MAERKGNPTVGLTMPPEEVSLVDAYQRARGLRTRSRALHELIRFALGDNRQGASAMHEYLPEGAREPMLVLADQVLRRF